MLLLFASVLLSSYEPRLQFLVPTITTDAASLLAHIVVLISGGFFVGYLFEQVAMSFGSTIARFMCERSRTAAVRSEFERQTSDLNLILQQEPVLSGVVR